MNKSNVMKSAWRLFKYQTIRMNNVSFTFSEALKSAWAKEKEAFEAMKEVSELNLLPETIDFIEGREVEMLEEAKTALKWAISKSCASSTATVSQVLNASVNFSGNTGMFKAAMQQVNA